MITVKLANPACYKEYIIRWPIKFIESICCPDTVQHALLAVFQDFLVQRVLINARQASVQMFRQYHGTGSITLAHHLSLSQSTLSTRGVKPQSSVLFTLSCGSI